MTAARFLMGDSLAFHLLFVVVATGLPLLVSALELYGWLRRRPQARRLAAQWARLQAVVFGFMLLSSVVVGWQFKLFWPQFVSLVHPPLWAALRVALIAWAVEAVLVMIYWFSWQRLAAGLHWLCGLLIGLAGLVAIGAITSVNAFMNTPAGFAVNAQGQFVDFHIRAALFNAATPVYVSHSLAAYSLACAAMLLGWYACRYRRTAALKRPPWLSRLLIGLAAITVGTGLLVVVLGDRSARFMAKYEPHKFAASQGVMQTRRRAPLTLGGVPTSSGVKYGLSVPGLLSLLAGNSVHTQVVGWQEFPADARPPLLVHSFFDGMILAGSLLVVLPGVFLVLVWRRPAWAYSRGMLGGLSACLLLGPVGVWCGWLVTELGRQPYVVQGYLRVADALTNNAAVLRWGFVFPMIFIGLWLACVVALRRWAHETV